MRVRRFTEKPNREKAEEFMLAGTYYWNSGIFLWTARTLANAIREHLSETAPFLQQIADAYKTPRFEEVFRELYRPAKTSASTTPCSSHAPPRANTIRISTAYHRLRLERLGSWEALYEHQLTQAMQRWQRHRSERLTGSRCSQQLRVQPGEICRAGGVENLVVVETEDAILITTRERSQDVRRVVSELAGKHDELI